MANNCRVAKDVKCRICNTQGHIQSACSQGKAQSPEESQQVGNNDVTLALEYQQPQLEEYSAAQVNVIRAATQQGNDSWPTPPMLL